MTPDRKKLGGASRSIEEMRVLLDDWHAGRLEAPDKKTTKVR